MKIDLTKVLKTIDGDVICDQEKNHLTLKRVIVNALLIPSDPRDKKLTGDEMLQLYLLADKINKCQSEIDLSTEEIVLIKSKIAAVYVSPIICGQSWEMLEGRL